MCLAFATFSLNLSLLMENSAVSTRDRFTSRRTHVIRLFFGAVFPQSSLWGLLLRETGPWDPPIAPEKCKLQAHQGVLCLQGAGVPPVSVSSVTAASAVSALPRCVPLPAPGDV